MKIEVYGQCNEDGSTHPLWEFEIKDGCQRVLVTLPGFVRDQATPNAWGFKDDRKVNAYLVDHVPELMIVG